MPNCWQFQIRLTDPGAPESFSEVERSEQQLWLGTQANPPQPLRWIVVAVVVVAGSWTSRVVCGLGLVYFSSVSACSGLGKSVVRGYWRLCPLEHLLA